MAISQDLWELVETLTLSLTLHKSVKMAGALSSSNVTTSPSVSKKMIRIVYPFGNCKPNGWFCTCWGDIHCVLRLLSIKTKKTMLLRHQKHFISSFLKMHSCRFSNNWKSGHRRPFSRARSSAFKNISPGYLTRAWLWSLSVSLCFLLAFVKHLLLVFIFLPYLVWVYPITIVEPDFSSGEHINFDVCPPQWLSRWRICLQCRRYRRCWFNTWVRKISWRRKWQPIPVFLPEKSHGQRSLVGYAHTHTHAHTHTLLISNHQPTLYPVTQNGWWPL